MKKLGKIGNNRIISKKAIKKAMIFIAILSCLLLFSKVNAEQVSDYEKLNVTSLIGGFGLVILWFIRLVFLIIVLAIYFVISLLFGNTLVSVDQIFFSKIPMLNLDFLLSPSGSTQATGIASSLSFGYWIIFYIVISIQLILLIYAAIRYIVGFKSGEEKADAKMILITWAKGFFMLVGVIVIAFLIVYSNHYICRALDNALQKSDALNGNILLDLAARSLKGIGLDANISFILATGLIVTTVIMFFYYLRRAVRIGFLIAISPLVSLTYVLNGFTGKSKAFSTWLKELTSNVYIQLFHILIYIGLILPIANLGLIQKDTSFYDALPSMLLAFFGLAFIFSAEDLVKGIFSDKISKAESTTKSIATALVVKDLAKKGYELTKKEKEKQTAERIKELRKNTENDKDKLYVMGKNNDEKANGTGDGKDSGNENLENGQEILDENNIYNDKENTGDKNLKNLENTEKLENTEDYLVLNDSDLDDVELINVNDENDDYGEDTESLYDYSDGEKDKDNEEKKLSTFEKARIALKKSSARKYNELNSKDAVERKRLKNSAKSKIKRGAKKALKLGTKVGASYTGAIMGQAANKEMVLGATLGAVGGAKLTDKAFDKMSNNRGFTKKKLNENYVNAVRTSARNQVGLAKTAGKLGTYDSNGKLKSFNTDTTTEEGIRNYRNYCNEIYKKQNDIDKKTGDTKLDEEYKKAYNNFIKEVEKRQELSAREASEVADSLIDYILSGKELEISGLQDHERELVKAVNDQQIAMELEDLKQYTMPLEQNRKVEMQKDIITDAEGEDLGSIEDMIMLMGEEKEKLEKEEQMRNSGDPNNIYNNYYDEDEKIVLREELDRLYDEENIENKYMLKKASKNQDNGNEDEEDEEENEEYEEYYDDEETEDDIDDMDDMDDEK